jgi:TetR/AcrR family transcriptional repressor of nem operon
VTETSERRADVTRQHILAAAAHQFAHRPYSQVSLDDILAEARVTKGAMYFHFRSKHALASAIIDEQGEIGRRAANEVFGRRLSGFETIIDLWYLIAVQDISDVMSRAGMNLLEEIGRAGVMKAKLVNQWLDGFSMIMRRAIDEGDVVEHVNPESASRFLVSLYMGMRQTSELSDPQKYFADLEQVLLLVLPSLVSGEQIAYMTQFIKRRTALASTTSPLPPFDS